MSAIATITVFDGASTPVVHNLAAVSVTRLSNQAIQAYWREQLAALPTEAQVWAIAKQETIKGGIVKSEFSIGVPVMEAILNQNAAGYTAAPKVAYTDKNVWTNFAHPRSTLTSRRLCKQLLTNVSNNVTTTVAAATSGPFDELVSQQLMPT